MNWNYKNHQYSNNPVKKRVSTVVQQTYKITFTSIKDPKTIFLLTKPVFP